MPHWRKNIVVRNAGKKHPAIFEGCTYDDLADDYDSLPSIEDIVYAYQSDTDYSEQRTIIFKRDGKFYEIEDSHCSCNGWCEDGQNNGFENPAPANEVTREYLLRRFPILEGKI